MATVRGQLGIFTKAKARKPYRCHGWNCKADARNTIQPGDTYFRSALPPHSEIGNETWWLARLCVLCAPNELTHPQEAQR